MIPRQTYKALLWDYDYLLEKSDEECCYSLSEREVQIILAIVDYIGWKTRYAPTSSEIDQLTINSWSGNLTRKLMSGCCPDDGELHRFDEDGDFQTSTDGGVTWEDDPENDPRNDAIQSPPLPGSDGVSKRCAAADNVRDLFTQYRDNLNDMLTASPTLVALIAGILAFIAVITGVSGAAIGISVLLMGLAAGLLELSEGEILEQIDTEVLETFKCLVYCRMNNTGQLTYTAWKQLLVDIAAEFSDFPELFFYQTVNAMGYIGINNAGTIGAATADDCDGCDCPLECGDPGLFSAGTVNSITTDEFGNTVFNVSSVDNGSGTQYVAWGDRFDSGSECCKFVFTDLASGAALGSAAQACGSDVEVPDGLGENECVHYFHIYKNFALGTPFTCNVVMNSCD